MFTLFFLGLAQLVMCAALVVKAVRWTRRHPLGADAGYEFFGLQLGTLVAGAIVAILLVSIFGPPHWSALTRGDSNAWMVLGYDLAAGLFAVPAAGLAGGLTKKANLVALLAAVGALPGLGAITFGVYVILDGCAGC